MNEYIEAALQNIHPRGKPDFVKVAQGFYHGHEEDYIVYSLADTSSPFFADDEMLAWHEYYDIDIYTKGDVEFIVDQVMAQMTGSGFDWQPSRSSGDLYETDTGYHHRTLSFLYLHKEAR